ncbi:dnaJ homolog subfamily C member 10-like [Ostrea edulis]|uniref:dnaJ homolog subfamily C member 10-like n=1 Tax=Ostrea edulis TaxID=37623 RepID=UPI0024AF0FEA|nr:dnaJ homolog subfamily C member 10-like [Ostrea edulis]XP_048776637.2 dnaJ homolog subfamily C member 10-like [Ostrea edulis]
MRQGKVFIWFLFMLSLVLAGEDFYELLGVERSATVKEIRKAFKRLAITKHPDKNLDDPTAHQNFLKITRAYEVLKDDELRKKYDLHGEEGLKEDFHGGGQYESWSFYNEEFGIYDDDQEIITLSRSDFEQSVDETQDIWFINFYSPHCSHCHELAPAWREVAKELEGVIRIGAVNCEDDYMLCQQNGIHSFPSLVMFPDREKYHGNRGIRDLVRYALKFVKADVIELWEGNFQTSLDENSDKPWLIAFCGEEACLSRTNRLKLSAILADVVNFGTLRCKHNENLCAKLGREHGIIYYGTDDVAKDKGTEISGSDPQEIAFQVMSQLPDVKNLDKDIFENIVRKMSNGQDKDWLVHFVDDEEHQDIEFRKLPAMLPQFRVGRVNCRKLWNVCRKLHVNKFPAFYVFKRSGGYEIYYGRATSHDVSAFARDSAGTKLVSLGPDDFNPNKVGPSSREPWFVDFFAPWCPPCMRLLPEFRKAARDYDGGVNFGTVDCTIHGDLCQTYNIRSYPTTIFYNQSIPHQYHGHHDSFHILEFIQDTLNPPLVNLDRGTFRQLVHGADIGMVWIVDFFAPWCGPCQQLAPEWRKLAKMLKDFEGVKIGQVDCQAQGDVCSSENIQSYPSIRLYSKNTEGLTQFYQYNSWSRNAVNIMSWMFESNLVPSYLETVNQNTFYWTVLRSSTPWLIDFYAPWCNHCHMFRPKIEVVAKTLKGRVKIGKVNCDMEQSLCQQVALSGYPSVRFYRGISPGQDAQHPYGEDIEIYETQDLLHYLRDILPNASEQVSESDRNPLDHDEL